VPMADAWYGTPSTATSTPDHGQPNEGFDGLEAPWAPYAFFEGYDPSLMDWGGQWDPELQYAGMDSDFALDFSASSTPSAAMLEILKRRAPTKPGREKDKKKRVLKSPSGTHGAPSQLSNPSRPRLQELRNLPQRGLGLQWMKDERKFQVVELQASMACESPGPAATVLRLEEGNAVLDGANGLPSLENLTGSVVCWTVQNWIARRYEANPLSKEWVETESVQLEPGDVGMEQEWARRFSQREKQLLVGKGTRGYRRFLRDIPKLQRKSGDPSTPRVAEQCSKRAFDGRLKQWRILLHAFSPRESEDEAETKPDKPAKSPAPETPQERARRVPPTPPKPTVFGEGSHASPANGGFSTPVVAGVNHDSLASMDFALPFPSPLSPFPGDSEITAHFAQSSMLAPEAVSWQGELGELSIALTKLSLAQTEQAPSPSSSPEPGALAELLPMWLLDEEKLDLDSVLARAQVSRELASIFKQNFAQIGDAWRKPHDEREELLTAASRSVLAAINQAEPKVEATPLEVLDMLLRFANELRLLFARAR